MGDACTIESVSSEPRGVSTSSLLIPIVRERARVLAPTLLVGISFYVATASWLGVDLPAAAVRADLGVIAVLATLSVFLVRRQIHGRWIHVASMVVWWCPISVTLMSEYVTGDISQAFLLGTEIATAGILLHTGCAAGSLVGVTCLAVPLVIRDGGENVPILIFTIVISNLFALLIHVLMRKSIVSAELHRLAEVETARKLALQVAELERAHEERTRLQTQLLHSQRMDAVGTLAAGIAHDMNNILASVSSFSSLMLDDIDQEDEVHRRQRRVDLEQVLAQAARGASLTQSLLAFSRRGQYRKQVVTIGNIIGDVLPLLGRTLPKAIEIVARIEVGDARVDGDPVHLQQALVNLGINAADAMRGSGVIQISATLVDLPVGVADPHGRQAGRYVRIAVTDAGIGMSAETRGRVFEPFFTTKPVGEGTGLGLSMVWGIAQAHGGSVEVESELAKGSTFSLMIPTTEAAAVSILEPVTARQVVHKGTVLVVDDEPAVRRGTSRILDRMGFEVIEACNGAEAVRLFSDARARVVLVVLDMGMPVMSGAECFASLREQSEVPILVVTGYAIATDAQALVSAGAGILEKPFRPNELQREVARMLPRKAIQNDVAGA